MLDHQVIQQKGRSRTGNKIVEEKETFLQLPVQERNSIGTGWVFQGDMPYEAKGKHLCKRAPEGRRPTDNRQHLQNSSPPETL